MQFLNALQSPVATKADDENKPEGSAPAGDGPASKSPEATHNPTPPQPQPWNPFKSRARLPLPPEPEEEAAGDGGKGSRPAKHGRPFVAVPSDHEILTSLPPDKIWGNMQQHASEGTLNPNKPCVNLEP